MIKTRWLVILLLLAIALAVSVVLGLRSCLLVASSSMENYKEKSAAVNARVILHSITIAESIYREERDEFASCKDADCASLLGFTLPEKTFRVEMASTPNFYTVTIWSIGGTTPVLRYDSRTGEVPAPPQQ